MNAKKGNLSLVDMDVGLFLSYEIASDLLITKLFRFIRLKSTPLGSLAELREADHSVITPLNRLNWFDNWRKRKRLCPVYTLQASEKSPRIFMRLSEGSHMLMKKLLKETQHEA